MSEKKNSLRFEEVNPASAILDCIASITLNPLKGMDQKVGHLDICIRFRYPVVRMLFETLIVAGLEVIVFDKNDAIIRSTQVKKIERISQNNVLFLSFIAKQKHKDSTIVTAFVPVEVGYRLTFFYPDDKDPVSKKFVVLSAL